MPTIETTQRCRWSPKNNSSSQIGCLPLRGKFSRQNLIGFILFTWIKWMCVCKWDFCYISGLSCVRGLTIVWLLSDLHILIITLIIAQYFPFITMITSVISTFKDAQNAESQDNIGKVNGLCQQNNMAMVSDNQSNRTSSN